MKKTIITMAAIVTAAVSASAGGFITNTNQSIAFLRMPAQTGVISVDGAYFNPAGTAFLSDGIHVGFNWIYASQSRQSTTTFAPFAYGVGNVGTSKLYKGETTAPFIPSFDLAYVHGKLSISAHFGILGGGGKLPYNNGLGSFESQIASGAAMLNSLGLPTSYSADMSLVGESYQYAGQISAAYRLADHFSVSAGLRYTNAMNSYNAAISNITFLSNGNPTAAVLNMMGMTAQAQMIQAAAQDKALECKQTAGGFAPILGVDYKGEKFNIAARYEFRTMLNYKNNTKINTSGLNQFDDSKNTRGDVPALLSIGASYSIINSVRLYASANSYFDKKAKTYDSESGLNDKQNLLGGNTIEGLGGVEVDVTPWLTLSTGVQITRYNFGDGNKYVSDMNVACNSNSLALGAKINIMENLSLDLGYFKTFFKELTKDYSVSGIPASDTYFRTSDALGLGAKFNF